VSCGIMLWLVTFVSIVPVGLLLSHHERLSLRSCRRRRRRRRKAQRLVSDVGALGGSASSCRQSAQERADSGIASDMVVRQEVRNSHSRRHAFCDDWAAEPSKRHILSPVRWFMKENSRPSQSHIDSIVKQEEEALERRSSSERFADGVGLFAGGVPLLCFSLCSWLRGSW